MRKKKKNENTFISSHIPTPHVQVPNERPKETRRSVIPLPEELVSTARTSTGHPASVAREAFRRSVCSASMVGTSDPTSSYGAWRLQR